jgi:hypothetical protein
MQDVPERKTKDDVKAFAGDPSAQASLLLTIGPALWKWISHISNVDFLLNATGENFNMALTFLQGPGWFLLTCVGFIWLSYNWIFRKRGGAVEPGPNWALLISSAIVAFLFGVLCAVNSTGAVPQTIMAWGSGDVHTCAATVNTAKLVSFRKDYKVAVVCGFQDVTKDRLDDETISVSNLFTITGSGISITMPVRDVMQKKVSDLIEQAKAATGNPNVSVQMPTWYDVVLLPNDVMPSKISKLGDVITFKGKILNPQYFD